MCFQIPYSLELPWKNRIVYKVLQIHGKSFRSPVQGALYRLNKVKSIKKNAMTDRWGYAFEGLYVYRTKEFAIERTYGGQVVVACKVHPEDFLHTNASRETATYRKLTPIKIVFERKQREVS